MEPLICWLRYSVTYSKELHNSLCEAHHVHGDGDGVGEGEDQADRATKLWAQTSRYQIIRPSWKGTIKWTKHLWDGFKSF